MDGNTEDTKTAFYVQSYEGAWSNGLTIHYLAQRLYWTDAEVIQYIQLCLMELVIMK